MIQCRWWTVHRWYFGKTINNAGLPPPQHGLPYSEIFRRKSSTLEMCLVFLLNPSRRIQLRAVHFHSHSFVILEWLYISSSSNDHAVADFLPKPLPQWSQKADIWLRPWSIQIKLNYSLPLTNLWGVESVLQVALLRKTIRSWVPSWPLIMTGTTTGVAHESVTL